MAKRFQPVFNSQLKSKVAASVSTPKPFLKVSVAHKDKIDEEAELTTEEEHLWNEDYSQIKQKLLLNIQKPLENHRNVTYMSFHAVKCKLFDNSFWFKLLKQATQMAPFMNKKSLVVTANSISEAFKIVSTQGKSKEAAVEAIKNIIEKSQSKVSSFNIEQLCILIKAQAHVLGNSATSEFKTASINDICNRESVRSPQELIQLLQVHYKYFKDHKLTESQITKYNQLIVKEATRFIQEGIVLQIHEVAYIHYELTKIRKSADSNDAALEYIEVLIKSNAALFSLEDVIFLTQSLTNSAIYPNSIKEDSLKFLLECIDSVIMKIKEGVVDNVILSPLQIVTFLNSMSALKSKGHHYHINLHTAESLKIQEQQEFLALFCIKNMPPKDYGFLYLICNSLKQCLTRDLVMHDLFLESIMELVTDNSEYLDGRLIQQFSVNFKLKSIDFWAKIEELYSQRLLKEEPYKIIEALNGFCSANRGSQQFLDSIQQVLLERLDSRLKTMDLVRAMQALSMISDRVNIKLLQKIRQELNQRLSNTKFKVIDLVSFIQAEIRFGNSQQVKDLQKLIIMAPEELNSKLIVNLVEIYSQISNDQLLPEFKDLVVNYVLENYKSVSLDQLGALMHYLKIKQDDQTIAALKDMAINDEKLLTKPQVLKEMLKILNQ